MGINLETCRREGLANEKGKGQKYGKHEQMETRLEGAKVA